MARRTPTDPTFTPPPPARGPSEPSNSLAALLQEIQKADAEVGRGLSLTSAVQIARPWIESRHKTLGWARVAEIYRTLGYSHANAKNTRQAYDSEDSALVRDLTKTEEGQTFLRLLTAVIAGAPLPEGEAARQRPALPAHARSSVKPPVTAQRTEPRSMTSAAAATDVAAEPQGLKFQAPRSPQVEVRENAPKARIFPRLE